MLSLSRVGLALARQPTAIARPLCTAAARVVEHPNPLSTLAEDETFIVEAVRSYAGNEIQPKVAQMDAAGAIDPDILAGLFAQGFMGVNVHADYGGTQSSFAASCLVVEELAREDAGVATVCELQNALVNGLLSAHGSEDQKNHHLPLLVSDTLGAVVAHDADVAGSTAVVARPDGDGYVLEGSRAYCTQAEAGLLLVLADVQGSDAKTLFLVDPKAAGIALGAPLDKMGLRAAKAALVDLQGVRVGSDSIVGQAGQAAKYWHDAKVRCAISGAALMVGLARGVYDSTMPYLYQRVQFGTAIANFQGMQHQRAQVATEIEAARLHVYNAARLLDHGMEHGQAAGLAWNYSSRVARKASSMSIEWLGGVGFTKDFRAEKYYRDAKANARFALLTSNI